MDPDGSDCRGPFFQVDERDRRHFRSNADYAFYLYEEYSVHLILSPTRQRASPVLRERFLSALDERDQPAIRATVRDLLGCVNILPAVTCNVLGLARGSTYGDAAQVITSSLTPRPEAA